MTSCLIIITSVNLLTEKERDRRLEQIHGQLYSAASTRYGTDLFWLRRGGGRHLFFSVTQPKIQNKSSAGRSSRDWILLKKLSRAGRVSPTHRGQIFDRTKKEKEEERRKHERHIFHVRKNVLSWKLNLFLFFLSLLKIQNISIKRTFWSMPKMMWHPFW
jgi:hypothetical protein